MAMAQRKTAFLRKYYIYDPGVTAGDELGGQMVRVDADEKGVYVLAAPIQMQYWIDQGLAGTEPASSLKDEAKEVLKQFTRGRSEDPFELPTRVPKYSRSVQSGAPIFAGQPASVRMKKRQKERQKDRTDKPPKKPEPKTEPKIYGPAE